MPKLGKPILISGTDTGIGKTLLTAGLVAWLNASRVKTLGMKPFACGGVRKNGRWVYEDVEMLKEANRSCLSLRRAKSLSCHREPRRGVAISWSRRALQPPFEIASPTARNDIDDAISPLRWKAPLAPFRASLIEKKPVSFQKVRRSLEYLKSRSDLVLLEGVGGLLCPLTARVTVADWAKKEGIPVIIVARLGLGTLNHTLMTLEVAKSRGIMVKGIILNDLSPGTSVANKLARHWNPLDIEKLVNVPLLGIFPFLKQRTVEASKKAWKKHFDLKRIKRSLSI